MLPYEPESTSEILRATHIATAVVESADMGDWAPGGEMLVRRTGVARFRIERVLKGGMDLPPDGVVEVSVQQFANKGPRIVAVPGVWSRAVLTPGARLAVLSKSATNAAAAVLSEPAVFRVEPADPADAAIAFLSESATLEKSLPALVSELAVNRAWLTLLISRYVAWRLRELLFSDLTGFDAVLAEAEDPQAPDLFRRIVVTEAYDDLLMLAPAEPEFIARLITGSLRMFASGTGIEMASRILETYIPNLLGMEGDETPLSPGHVFDGQAALRQELQSILHRHADLPGRERLLEWLEN